MARIYKYEPSHGPVLHRLIAALEQLSDEYTIQRGMGKYSYLVKSAQYDSSRVDKSIGLFIKYSNKKLSPWRYTIYKAEQEELEILQELCSTVFLIIVNGFDGIACLTFKDLKEILDENYGDSEWISVKRRLHTEYRIAGSDGRLEKKIATNSFPKIVINKLQEL